MTAAPVALTDAVTTLMREHSVPGLALGVLHERQVETWGFGVASIETGQPVTAGTLFQAGSISKVFATTLVMRLVDEGKLDLDRPVITYLPKLRLADAAATRAVTLRHLLTHTAGFDGDRFEDYGGGDDAIARAIAEFHTLRQYTPPGELWAYCNTGFQLAGAVAAAVARAPFEEAMRRLVLEPLGLTRTVYFAHEAITYPVAVGHNLGADGTPEVARLWARPRARSPQGGVVSTVEDLLRFAAFHLGDGTPGGRRLLSETSLHVMQHPWTPADGVAHHYGLGWALRTEAGRAVVEHGGVTNGFRARLSLVPDARFALAILTNGSGGTTVTRVLGDDLLRAYAGVGRHLSPAISLPPADLARLAGRYLRPGNEIQVEATGTGLRLTIHHTDAFTKLPTPPFTLHAVPIAPLSFRIADGSNATERFSFIPGDDGRPRFIRFDGRLADRAT